MSSQSVSLEAFKFSFLLKPKLETGNTWSVIARKHNIITYHITIKQDGRMQLESVKENIRNTWVAQFKIRMYESTLI